MFNPARLTLARQRRKLTKKGLAEALGVDVKTVVRWENGEPVPPPESIDLIARTLGFPVAFFLGPDIDEPLSQGASFRSLSAMTARDRDAALAAGALSFLLSDWADGLFKLPSHDLIDFKEGASPEAAARHLREKWGIGERPVGNLVHTLEAKGVRVFSLAENTRTVDAFSMWRREIPYIFLNTMKTAERSRFDAAHELGHLVLHKHGGPRGRAAEDQANQFASAFLLPEAQVRAKLPIVVSLNQIVEAKRIWGVSVAALNYRLHRLRIISPWQYRMFCIQIAKLFLQEEPGGLPGERSMLWDKILLSLRQDKITKRDVATAVCLPVEEVENLLFRLTNMQSIEGTTKIASKSRAHLHLVKP